MPKKNTQIDLPANMDMAHAASLLDSALRWQSQNSPLLLNARNIERMGTSAAQIMLSLCHSRKKQGHETCIHQPCETFTSTIATLGLAPHFKEFIHE